MGKSYDNWIVMRRLPKLDIFEVQRTHRRDTCAALILGIREVGQALCTCANKRVRQKRV